MRILFLTHYFPPEGNAPASRTYEHCVRWVKAGHDVTVITGVPNVPDGVVYAGYRNRLRTQSEDVHGIHVRRVWTYLAPNKGFVRRIINYLSFMVTGTWAALFVARPTVIVATSPQFFCGWAGVLASRLRRVPLVLEIRDIWPESIAAVGAMKKGMLIRCLEWLEKRMYLAADRIVAVGEGYRANILGKVPVQDRVTVVYNGVDGTLFAPRTRDPDYFRQRGLDAPFICSYVGTIGLAHGLTVVLDAAKMLRERNRSDIGFCLVGDGAERAALQRRCRELGVESLVLFTGRLPKETMPEVLANSHAMLVHLRDCELFDTVIPSKIFEAMAMERPIIMGVRGESADIVRRSGGGLDMIPGDPGSLVDCVCRLRDDPALYASLSTKARAFVLEQFSRDHFADRMLGVLTAAAASRSGD